MTTVQSIKRDNLSHPWKNGQGFRASELTTELWPMRIDVQNRNPNQDLEYEGKVRLDNPQTEFVSRLYLGALKTGNRFFGRHFRIHSVDVKNSWTYDPDYTRYVNLPYWVRKNEDLDREQRIDLIGAVWIPELLRLHPLLRLPMEFHLALCAEYYRATRVSRKDTGTRNGFWNPNWQIFWNHHPREAEEWWFWFRWRKAAVFRAFVDAAWRTKKGNGWYVNQARGKETPGVIKRHVATTSQSV